MRLLSKSEFAVSLVIVGAFAFVLGVFLPYLARVDLADPKPKLPPLEKNRVHHPKGFSIVAPKGWEFAIETAENRRVDRIWIQANTEARWSAKLIVSSYSEGQHVYHAMDPNEYVRDGYLEFDARIYEGLWHDYHGWHAMFSHKGERYEVLLMLPHGHGPPRYDKVPDHWWPFLNSFHIGPNTD